MPLTTPQHLSAHIRKLREIAPITSHFEQGLTKRGAWDSNQEWYATQKEHWLGWLGAYKGEGYYHRKNWHRSAEFVYNHINCPPMLLWLVEASGVPTIEVTKAMQSALKAKRSFPAQCAAIRVIIPWEKVKANLGKKVSINGTASKKIKKKRDKLQGKKKWRNSPQIAAEILRACNKTYFHETVRSEV